MLILALELMVARDNRAVSMAGTKWPNFEPGGVKLNLVILVYYNDGFKALAEQRENLIKPLRVKDTRKEKETDPECLLSYLKDVKRRVLFIPERRRYLRAFSRARELRRKIEDMLAFLIEKYLTRFSNKKRMRTQTISFEKTRFLKK
ncbi:hypothetical protein RRG08_008267 [Elysia crispata]|uniref:Uncharacterized protein n=1 Tax=Elysia crispata TaxID=231223 RepID=A0AAE0ZM98_9GAST|nr:hypothetical protein RRG08_008267 [Elysia crispata]